MWGWRGRWEDGGEGGEGGLGQRSRGDNSGLGDVSGAEILGFISAWIVVGIWNVFLSDRAIFERLQRG